MFTWCRSHSPIAVPCASEKHRIPSDPRVVLSQLSRASRRYSGRKTTQDCLRRSTLRTAGCCGSRSESSPQQRPCGAPGTRAPPGSIFQDAVRVRTRLRPRRRLGPGENDACERACVRPREPIEDGHGAGERRVGERVRGGARVWTRLTVRRPADAASLTEVRPVPRPAHLLSHYANVVLPAPPAPSSSSPPPRPPSPSHNTHTSLPHAFRLPRTPTRLAYVPFSAHLPVC